MEITASATQQQHKCVRACCLGRGAEEGNKGMCRGRKMLLFTHSTAALQPKLKELCY